ncbi:MAG: BRCT domain-containing protein [Proteobacteria bacterium]|nr:BRCT domain-containing protein [Pseudomonadota bacterium]
MHQEEIEYIHFAAPQILDKELHTLEGILKGIAIDNKITSAEIQALLGWCDRHQAVSHKSPFNEIIPLIKKAVEDGNVDEEEKEDIQWLCQKYITPNKYYDHITSDMQRLHGILAGIVADGKITEDELKGLQNWLSDHEQLRTIWPFDEIDSLITEIMSDGVIDEQEHHVLVNFCNQFLAEHTSMILDLPIESDLLRQGVCSAMPTLEFENKKFCLTGSFEHGTKNEVSKIVKEFKGNLSKGVRKDLDYLIIGGKGSECWAFACYGRKVEKAMNYRKDGLQIQIVHEFDFMDAVEDLR